MRVLHLSTGDGGGGAYRAAFRLHSGLRRLSVDSKMLVLRRSSDDPNVSRIQWSSAPLARLRRGHRRRQIHRDFAAYQSTLPHGFEIYSDDRSEAGYDLVRQLPECDLINLHWVGGFLDHQLFFNHLPPGVPLVWRLADMNPFTGGCHYDGGCGKFTANCGACPILGSSKPNDLSRRIWKRKHDSLAKMPDDRMHIVGTSRWITTEAGRSSLLNRFKSTVIPNGLDTADFAPRDKQFARDTLSVPANAKVVLFVADSAAIHRKGFDYVAAALASMATMPGLFLLSVGAGKPNVPNLPQLHLGRITNDRLLSVIYSAADVFVMPSLQESFGQTITESMACGTPVVGFNTGGIPDMVRPGVTGELAKVGDAVALTHAISQLLDNPIRCRAMSENCRRIAVEEYSLETQAQAYLRLYRSLLQR
jgi:glycosyltransferase involved in cell wall biosynthesis